MIRANAYDLYRVPVEVDRSTSLFYALPIFQIKFPWKYFQIYIFENFEIYFKYFPMKDVLISIHTSYKIMTVGIE